MNFREYLNEQNEYKKLEIIYKDDGSLLKLIDHIRNIGNVGHSFSVIVDPEGDKNEKKSIDWDGDGYDYIKSIQYNGEEIK